MGAVRPRGPLQRDNDDDYDDDDDMYVTVTVARKALEFYIKVTD